MLILLSPAKTLDFSPRKPHAATKPAFLSQANKLAKTLRHMSPAQIGKLMSISPKLADEVHEYHVRRKAKHDASGAKEAIFAFHGDVYLGLNSETLTASDLSFVDKHVRILSGLYGVLRPFDLIQPYRLEMSTPLAGEYGRDLYAHWGDQIAKCLAKELKTHDEQIIVNLASQEYFAVARAKTIGCRVITPSFRDRHDGKYKALSFFSKKARGLMARHLIESRCSAAAIDKFRTAGYRYNRELSAEDAPTFIRDNPPSAT